MIWGGNMEKILRLSFANIKKHKKQTILLTLLIVFCMAVTSAAAAGSIDMTGLFPRVADEYAVHKNALYIKEDYYNDSFIRLLREDERVTDIDHVRVLFSTATKYLDKEGEEQALYMSFVTKELEKNIERSPIETTLTDEEIAALEHPIYLPYAGQESLASKLSEGDTFNIIYGTKLFSFTVAGFYESIFMPTTGMGFQMIVSDSDYVSLMTIIGKYEMVLFDCNPLDDCVDIYLKFYDRVEEQTGKDIGYNILSLLYKNLEQKSAVFSEIVIGIMLFMAVVIFIAAAIMIRFRIAGDIQDQIQSIGVLEALGYTSKEIALSYTAEYLMTALAGVIIGAGGAFALLPVLHRVAETLSGHHGSLHISPLPILLTALIILIFVGVIAHTRALAVKKYPPVRAFRKGIAVHHFGKNRFPLRNTKNSVHLRLALKGFFDNMKQNISLTVCIAVSALAAVAGILIADLFASDLKAAAWLTGEEMPDQIVTVMHSVNTEELAERISEMQGVKRVQTGSFSLDLSEWRSLYAFDRESCLVPVSYPDFSQCENIQATAGRLPEHDNEIAVSKLFATQHSLKVGDNLTLECNRVKKNYIICGFIPSMCNDGTNLYITEQALKRIMPTYRPSAIEIYLEDKTDRAEFQTLLMQTYGRSVADTRKTESIGDTAEERLRAEADRLIAEYLANHGADHIEYSIQIGDKTISGSSESFAIKNVQDIKHVLQTQMGGIFSTISLTSWSLMGIAAVVSAIIIIALMEQAVRRQRKELGIMLGLGYTTKELMVQLAMRIMPAVIVAIILGTVGAAAVFHAVMDAMVGTTPINIPMIIIAMVIMILFCFGCAYVGAGRIKKISVTELMTE